MDTAIWSAIAKNQLLRFQRVAGSRNKRLLEQGYVPEKNSAEYIKWTYRNCKAQVRHRRPISGTVLELGPGGNVGTTLLFLRDGCDRGYCIDVFPFISSQPDLYQELVDNPDELLQRIDYRCPEAIEDTALPDGSIDIIFSNACLEHVIDPAGAARRISTLLKPGGVTTHGIDLRDHRNFELPLDFLRYPEWMWQAASSRRTHTNRWRASDWSNAFQAAGLVDIRVEPKEVADVTNKQRDRFAKKFRHRSTEDLGILQMEITASKPLR